MSSVLPYSFIHLSRTSFYVEHGDSRVEFRTLDYENPGSNPGCGVKTLGKFFHSTFPEDWILRYIRTCLFTAAAGQCSVFLHLKTTGVASLNRHQQLKCRIVDKNIDNNCTTIIIRSSEPFYNVLYFIPNN